MTDILYHNIWSRHLFFTSTWFYFIILHYNWIKENFSIPGGKGAIQIICDILEVLCVSNISLLRRGGAGEKSGAKKCLYLKCVLFEWSLGLRIAHLLSYAIIIQRFKIFLLFTSSACTNSYPVVFWSSSCLKKGTFINIPVLFLIIVDAVNTLFWSVITNVGIREIF